MSVGVCVERVSRPGASRPLSVIDRPRGEERAAMTEALRLSIEVQAEEEEEKPASLLDRIGIPRPLFWGFVGCLLFMIGDGVESGFLSPYMQRQGISAPQVALMFSVYGLSFTWASGRRGALSSVC